MAGRAQSHAKSLALEHEVAINELLTKASERGASASLPDAAVIAKCVAVFDELQASKVFGPNQRLMTTIKTLLYQALFSDEVTTDADGQLQKVPHALTVEQRRREVVQLQEDLDYQKGCFQDIDQDVQACRQQLKSTSEDLQATRAALQASQGKCEQLEADVLDLKTKLDRRLEDDNGNILHMAREVEAANQTAAEATDAAVNMRRYVEGQETRRKVRVRVLCCAVTVRGASALLRWRDVACICVVACAGCG